MATRTYLIFKENDKEVLNCQIFGNNFYDNTFFNEVVKLAGMTRFPECEVYGGITARVTTYYVAKNAYSNGLSMTRTVDYRIYMN